MFIRTAVALLGVLLGAGGTRAGEVSVVDVVARLDGDGRYSFSVTLRHGDEGWDHYANEWRVLAPDGTVLGIRVLVHPHVSEQPFTRSLGNVAVPQEIRRVIIDARDSRHGRTKKTFAVILPGR